MGLAGVEINAMLVSVQGCAMKGPSIPMEIVLGLYCRIAWDPRTDTQSWDNPSVIRVFGVTNCVVLRSGSQYLLLARSPAEAI